jgi:hypothetical protein
LVPGTEDGVIVLRALVGGFQYQGLIDELLGIDDGHGQIADL